MSKACFDPREAPQYVPILRHPYPSSPPPLPPCFLLHLYALRFSHLLSFLLLDPLCVLTFPSFCARLLRPRMWVRMESADTQSKSGFGGVASQLDFASTHPANQKRIKVSLSLSFSFKVAAGAPLG